MGWKTTVTTEPRDGHHAVRRSVHTYPYHILDTSLDDSKGAHTFLLNATVNISRSRSESVEGAGFACRSGWRGSSGSTLVGSTTAPKKQEEKKDTSHTLINLEVNDSNERYALSVRGLDGGKGKGEENENDGGDHDAACFSPMLHALAGHVRSEVAHESQCRGIPEGICVCRSDICGFFRP